MAPFGTVSYMAWRMEKAPILFTISLSVKSTKYFNSKGTFEERREK